jgi:uncharacterized protein (DUF2147 family)
MKYKMSRPGIKYAIFILIFLISIKVIIMETHNPTIPVNADAIIGKWRSEAQDSEMEIYKSGSTYKGKMLAGWGNKMYEADGKTLTKDTKNSDAKLRNRELLNLEFLTDAGYENGVYKGGELYLAVIGRTLKCRMEFEGDKLMMRMYVGLPLFGTTKKWSRI